jgi:uncharacterized paraquat-inducible protein A
MLAQLKSLVGRSQFQNGDDSSEQNSKRTEEATETTSLFRCQHCETVYIAKKKETCSTCHEDIQKVPATLT